MNQRKTGENPARPRHCKRWRNLHDSHWSLDGRRDWEGAGSRL